jgi:hypothetical protein
VSLGRTFGRNVYDLTPWDLFAAVGLLCVVAEQIAETVIFRTPRQDAQRWALLATRACEVADHMTDLRRNRA